MFGKCNKCTKQLLQLKLFSFFSAIFYCKGSRCFVASYIVQVAKKVLIKIVFSSILSKVTFLTMIFYSFCLYTILSFKDSWNLSSIKVEVK
jgi:hypothetical protein